MIETDRARRVALAVAATVFLGACDLDNLLEVATPDVVTPEDIRGTRGAELFAAGALGQFAQTFGSGQVLASGLLADEFHYGNVFPLQVSLDRRALGDRTTGTQGYRALHEARVGLENGADIVEDFLPGDPLLGQMHNLAGFTYVFFGEQFCSGVPFGRTSPTGEATQGVQKTSEQTFGIALEKFASAAAAAGGSVDVEHLAAVGAARALLDLGRYAEAGDRAAGVPTEWTHVIRYKAGSHSSQENRVYGRSRIGRDYSLSDQEGGNGLPFRTESDARVPWEFNGAMGANGETPQYELTKYASFDDDIVLASGIEARLVEAEAALQTSDFVGMMTKLNELRATMALGDLSDPGTPEARVDLLFSERARWMFATGHRLGDLRRLIRQYDRDPETVFPTGLYHLAGEYGTDGDFGIPEDENANPNFSGCFSRGG